MSKKTALQDALAQAAHGSSNTKGKAPEESQKSTGAQKDAKPHRVGRVNVTGYFDPAVKQSLRLIQSKYPQKTSQALLAEALNDLFAKYNVPQTADLKAS